MFRQVCFLVLFFFVCGVACASNIPDGILGKYSKQHNICFVGPGKASDGGINWTDCADVEDVLTITKGTETPYPLLQVEVSLNFSNGHGCHFEGYGFWAEWSERVEAKSKEIPACSMVFIFSGERVHLVTKTDSCQSLCGARGMLDGAILNKAH